MQFARARAGTDRICTLAICYVCRQFVVRLSFRRACAQVRIPAPDTQTRHPDVMHTELRIRINRAHCSNTHRRTAPPSPRSLCRQLINACDISLRQTETAHLDLDWLLLSRGFVQFASGYSLMGNAGIAAGVDVTWSFG